MPLVKRTAQRCRRPRASRARGVVAALALLLAACANSDAAANRELVVFAAASLRDGFAELGVRFERAHPGVRPIFNFAGTQQIRTQLEHGAQADVFAAADLHHMDELATAGRVLEPRVFARNTPVIVVARESGGAIRTLADLPNASGIVLGATEVPVGRYAAAILDRAGSMLGEDFRSRVEARVVSRELSTRQVLAKVSLGEAQAGIVYASDARSARDVSVVPIPDQVNVVAQYPIAVVSAAREPALARAFIELVTSRQGRAVLEAHGFEAGSGS